MQKGGIRSKPDSSLAGPPLFPAEHSAPVLSTGDLDSPGGPANVGMQINGRCCETCPIVRLALTDDDGDGRSTELLRATLVLGSQFSKGRFERVAFPCRDLKSIYSE